MVKVRLWGSLEAHTGGKREVEVQASTLRELLAALAQDYPGLKPQLDRGVSISIDGRIYNDAWFTEVTPESEVVLLKRLEGG